MSVFCKFVLFRFLHPIIIPPLIIQCTCTFSPYHPEHMYVFPYHPLFTSLTPLYLSSRRHFISFIPLPFLSLPPPYFYTHSGFLPFLSLLLPYFYTHSIFLPFLSLPHLVCTYTHSVFLPFHPLPLPCMYIYSLYLSPLSSSPPTMYVHTYTHSVFLPFLPLPLPCMYILLTLSFSPFFLSPYHVRTYYSLCLSPLSSSPPTMYVQILTLSFSPTFLSPYHVCTDTHLPYLKGIVSPDF